MTRPPAPTGRGRTLRPSPVGALAAAAGIPVLDPGRRPRARVRRRTGRPGARTPPRSSPTARCCRSRCSTFPPHGWINLHFSLLPAWRGAAPVHAAVRHGDDITGATTFRLEPGMDTGPVFGTVTETIRPTDTTGALLDRLATSGAALLVATLDGIEAGTLRARYRSRPTASATRRRSPPPTPRSTGPTRPPPSTAPIRSLTPEPGAWTTFRGERLGIGPRRNGPGSPPATCARACWPSSQGRARRHRDGAAAAGCGPTARPTRDAGRRLGAGHPRRRRRTAGRRAS